MDKELLEALNQMMETQKKEISDMMDEKLKPIKEDVSTIKDNLAELKEEHEITREGVNKLVGWAEGVGAAFNMPLMNK